MTMTYVLVTLALFLAAFVSSILAEVVHRYEEVFEILMRLFLVGAIVTAMMGYTFGQ